MQNIADQREKKRSARTDSAGAIWLIQVISGALLILLLGLFYVWKKGALEWE